MAGFLVAITDAFDSDGDGIVYNTVAVVVVAAVSPADDTITGDIENVDMFGFN